MIFFSLNVPGGSASVFLSLANELQRQGHTIDVYSYFWDPHKCFPDLTKNISISSVKKISSHELNNSNVFIKLQEGFNYYINAHKIFNIMHLGKYDIIYTSEASAYIPALRYKKRYHAPVVWSVFDPISLVDRERPGMIINKHKWFEYLLRVHNFFDSKNINKIDAILVPTNKMKKQLDSFYNVNSTVFPLAGIRRHDVEKSYVRLIEKRLQEKFSFIKKNEIILYSHGHFLPHRRYEDSLLALKHLVEKDRNIKFIISGSDKFDPSYFQLIKNLIESLSLENYVILDTEFKTNEEVIGYYQFSDIFLFVSVEQTWGLAPFEAMAAKKPVIISRGVGCHEVLKDNIHALIVDEKSPSHIINKVKKLLTDKKLYTFISNEGYKLATSQFSYSVIANNLVQYFNNHLIRRTSVNNLHY